MRQELFWNLLPHATEILDAELDRARKELDAQPGNIQLVMRLARVQILTSLCHTFGVAADLSSGYIPAKIGRETGVDIGSLRGNELAGSRRSQSPANACAPERGRASQDDVQGRFKQLSLEVDAN
jgi:hypothetical protein